MLRLATKTFLYMFIILGVFLSTFFITDNIAFAQNSETYDAINKHAEDTPNWAETHLSSAKERNKYNSYDDDRKKWYREEMWAPRHRNFYYSLIDANKETYNTKLSQGVLVADAWYDDSTGDRIQAEQKAKADRDKNLLEKAGDRVLDGMESNIIKAATSMIGSILTWALSIAAWIFAMIGWFLDVIVYHTVINFKATYESLETSVNVAWVFLRDLANIAFIFLILSTAISIIIGGDLFGKKKVLGMIIVVAITLNFSMFFVKAAVDVSNYATISIYESIKVGDGTIGDMSPDKSSEIKGIGVQIASRLGLTTFLNAESAGSKSVLAKLSQDNPVKLMQTTIFVIVFLSMAGIVFLYASLMLLWRFLAIILLIISSPVAIISTILPKGKEFWNSWLKELTTNLFFAPVFFLLLHLTLLFASRSFTAMAQHKSFANLGEFALNDASLLINFFLILLFLFISVLGARKISVSGSGFTAGIIDSSTKYATGRMKRVAGGATAGLAGAAGRATAGRAASRFANSSLLKGMAGAPIIGGFANKLRGGADKLATSSFDARATAAGARALGEQGKGGQGGYRGDIERKTKDKEEQANWVASLTDGEQQIDNQHNLVKASHEKAKKDQKETNDKIKEYEKELSDIRKDIVDKHFTPANKAIYSQASSDVRRLENKKEKDGGLNAQDTAILHNTKLTLNSLEPQADAHATAVEKERIDKINIEMPTLIQEKIDHKAKIIESASKLSESTDSHKEMKDSTKARVKEFEDKLEHGGWARKTVSKLLKSKNDGAVNNAPHWAARAAADTTGRRASRQAFVNRRTGGGSNSSS